MAPFSRPTLAGDLIAVLAGTPWRARMGISAVSGLGAPGWHKALENVENSLLLVVLASYSQNPLRQTGVSRRQALKRNSLRAQERAG